MRRIAKALFIAAGLINFVPAIGVLGAERLGALYGIEFAGADLLLLMRHRALLLGLVGALLIVSAIRPRLRLIAADLNSPAISIG